MIIQHSSFDQLNTSLPADMTTPSTNAGSTTGTATTSTDASIAATDDLGNETTFLQLLVSEIQNQDPTQPMDSSTFLSQLAEFSSVEQLIGIRQDVSELDPTTASTTSTTPATSSTTGS
jgi:flagellar basal-body rod modification protein FlgD